MARRQLGGLAPDDRKRLLLTRRVSSRAQSIADALVIKDRDVFFLSDPSGRVPLERGHGLGLYFQDCRFLDGYDISVGELTPEELGSEAGRGYVALIESTNDSGLPARPGEVREEDGQPIEKQQLEIAWHRVLDGGAQTLYDEISVRNAGPGRARFPIRLAFNAAFEDIFRIRGKLIERQGRHLPPVWHDGALRLAYRGADGLARSTWIRFEPPPDRVQGTTAEFEIDLAATERQHLLVAVTVETGPRLKGRPPDACRPKDRARADRERRHTRHRWLRESTSVSSGSLVVDAVVRRSLADLRMLISTLDGSAYVAAGVPWFVALFGRDSLVAAHEVLAFDTQLAADTLRLLARLQGRREDPWRDEQPGKIPHELRVGEYARLGLIPHTPYYGSVDSTPLFLCLLGEHAAWTGDLTLYRELREPVDRALAWLDRYGDADDDGYVEYAANAPDGLINQGWKDSGEAIVNGDGSLATPPIRLAEVQGYTYRARRLMAELFERDGDTGRAADLLEAATRLRRRFERDFWSEALGTYALALQGPTRRPVEVVASNAGQVLWSGIASPEHARRTADRLLRDDAFSGWGIHTLSTAELRYNPIGYHLGTVWPHDNALIAHGFRQYGCDDHALRLLEGLVEAAMAFPDYRLPETFAGFAREDYGSPVRYPVACHPQAWAAGAVPYLLTTCLGLHAEGFEDRLRVRRPVLPPFLPWLELRDLKVGRGQVDLRFEQGPVGVSVELLESRGEIQLVVEGAHRRDRRRRARRT
ncbi:MAG: amylo-alpha-1,6-glucosidase [Candidatus Limnocylindrales bacterium]